MAAGSELLIVDPKEGSRASLRGFFDERGYVCTAVGDAPEARGLVTQKFFPVALVDLDVDHPGGGVDLLRAIRERSRPTAVIVLTDRRSFEGAVDALRGGALDVVRKVPEQTEHLARVVERATERYQAQGDDELFREIRAVLDESFKVMLGLSRKVYAHLSMAKAPLKPRVMVVDGDPGFLQELSALVPDEGWEISGEMSGGAGLDKGLTTRLDIVASRDELPDLRGTMVLRSIQAQHGEVLGLLYSAADGSGRIDRVEHGQVEHTERPFEGAAHLVRRIRELADELGTRAQERRFIQAFSADHQDFLRRYAELKLKIDRLISD
ncbi:MAG TPA: response regulator [Sandaracinaceae bacterium LLY-WYZ-13_1]|nr:response regulator [Sandaracinaceae bacterium LLY-WYZ-13_1]